MQWITKNSTEEDIMKALANVGLVKRVSVADIEPVTPLKRALTPTETKALTACFGTGYKYSAIDGEDRIILIPVDMAFGNRGREYVRLQDLKKEIERQKVVK